MFGLRWFGAVLPSVACFLVILVGGVVSAWSGDSHSKQEVDIEPIETEESPSVSEVNQVGIARFVVNARALEDLVVRADFEQEPPEAVYARLKVFALNIPELKCLMRAVVGDLTGGVPCGGFLEKVEHLLWRLDAIFLRAAGQGADFFDRHLFDNGYEAEVHVVLELWDQLKAILGDMFPRAIEYQAATLHERYRAFNETLPAHDSVYRMVCFIVRNVREVGESLLDFVAPTALPHAFNRARAALYNQPRARLYPHQQQFLAAQLEVVGEPRNLLRGGIADDFEPILGQGDSEDDRYEDTTEGYWEALYQTPQEPGPSHEHVPEYLDMALAGGGFADLPEETVPWAFLNYGGAYPEPLPEPGPVQGAFVLPQWSPYHPVFLAPPEQGSSWLSYFMLSPQDMRWRN